MIQQVYEAVLAVLNKNNYGYLTPNDFNLYAQQAQLDLFEDVFYQYNNLLKKDVLHLEILLKALQVLYMLNKAKI